jgi:hypothetical protein
MASPFPGMDPFLEHPAYFAGLHGRMIALLAKELRERLPESYLAATEDRLWLEPVEQPALEHTIAPDAPAAGEAPPRAGVVIVTVPHIERRETFVEILKHAGDEERLVTVVELLTPAVKTPGQRGREVYLTRQRERLDTGSVHLVEIDLLRTGEHTTAVPAEALHRQAGPFDYHVCIRHFHQHDRYHVYPIRLEQRLPELVVPLLPEDGVVLLDLQAVFERCYTTGPYRLAKYDLARLNPPLAPHQQEWAARRLQAAGHLAE